MANREIITYDGTDAAYVDELKCFVTMIHYDFVARLGMISLLDGNCCDMSGSVRFFQRIDPDVQFIRSLYSDGTDDTVYRKECGVWKAYRSSKPRPIRDPNLTVYH